MKTIMTFECIILVWDDGVFKVRKRYMTGQENEITQFVERSLKEIAEFLQEEKDKLARIYENDDIPF